MRPSPILAEVIARLGPAISSSSRATSRRPSPRSRHGAAPPSAGRRSPTRIPTSSPSPPTMPRTARGLPGLLPRRYRRHRRLHRRRDRRCGGCGCRTPGKPLTMPPILLAIVLRMAGSRAGRAGPEQEATRAARPRSRRRGHRAPVTGIDYTLPQIAQRLARDGEGELIGLDLVDNDNRPFSGGRDRALPSRLRCSAPAMPRLVAVRVDPARSQSRSAAALPSLPRRRRAWRCWQPVEPAQDRLGAVPAGGCAFHRPSHRRAGRGRRASSIPPSLLLWPSVWRWDRRQPVGGEGRVASSAVAAAGKDGCTPAWPREPRLDAAALKRRVDRYATATRCGGSDR